MVYARLKVAQLALEVEAQRLALDESKGKLLDVRFSISAGRDAGFATQAAAPVAFRQQT